MSQHLDRHSAATESAYPQYAPDQDLLDIASTIKGAVEQAVAVFDVQTKGNASAAKKLRDARQCLIEAAQFCEIGG